MKVNSKESVSKLRFRKAVALFSILSILLFLNISCAKKEKETYTTRKAEESLALIPEEVSFGADIFLLLDQSGSMKGYPGSPATDPEGLRVQASKYLIRNIAQKATKELPHRMGIVNFGTTAPGNLTVPLTEVTKAGGDPGVQNLASSLRIISLGDTSFISALEAAYRGFVAKGTFNQSRKPVIIIFTDGEPDDPRKLTHEEYFEEIKDFVTSSLEPQGCDVYVIGIDVAASTWAKSAPEWKRILSDGHVYQISSMPQLQERFNEAIRQIFGIPPVPPDVVTPKGLEFEVPPYLEKIEFHVFPEREGLTLSVFGPDGKAIPKTSPRISVKEYETYDIITVMSPAYGKWRYQVLEGEGKIEVYRNAIPVKMKLISPKETHPLGKSMNFVASFLKSDSEEIAEIPEFPIGLTAKVIAPDGTEFDVQFRRGEKGMCFGTPSVESIEIEGTYRIMLTMKGGDAYKSSQERIIQVKSMPYVVVDNPVADSTLHFSKDMFIKASLMRNRKPVKPEDEFSDHPGVLILAQIVQMPDGGKSESIWLSPVPDSQLPGMFHGRLPVSLEQEGRYFLMTRLAGQHRSEEELPNDYSEVGFFAYPSFTQRSLGTFILALYIIGIVLTLIFIIWLLWALSLPRMRGHLYVYASGSESGSPLAQERLNRKKLRCIKVKKSGETPSIRLWINQDRKAKTRIRVRHKFLSRSKSLEQNASARIGRTHSVKYM